MERLQYFVDRVAEISERYGTDINIYKTNSMVITNTNIFHQLGINQKRIEARSMRTKYI